MHFFISSFSDGMKPDHDGNIFTVTGNRIMVISARKKKPNGSR